jgi:3-dehydroquinate dehydratase-1
MICISLVNKSYSECLKIIRKEEMVEVRMDLLDLNVRQVRKLFKASPRLIATFRKGIATDAKRFEYLSEAVSSGAAWVDIDLLTDESFRTELLRIASEKNCQVIVSYHNFALTPSYIDLVNIARECMLKGGALVKIACQVTSRKDVLNLLTLYDLDMRLIAIGMGNMGRITRIAAPFLGAEFTYASYETGEEAAPGQLGREEMRQILNLLNK